MSILIIMTWMAGYVSGTITTSLEFSSLQNCEAARIAIQAQTKDWRKGDQPVTVCVAK
jgi:hypothetical protein